MSPDKIDHDIRELRGTPLFPILVRVIEGLRQIERADYEQSPATEYGRGRVGMMNDLVNRISPSRR